MAWSAGRPRACAERDCNQQVDGPRLTVAGSQTDVHVSECMCVSAHNKRCELQEFMGQLEVSGDKLAESGACTHSSRCKKIAGTAHLIIINKPIEQ